MFYSIKLICLILKHSIRSDKMTDGKKNLKINLQFHVA